MKCKNCGIDVDKLIDDEICERCHDIWLDNLIKETDILSMVRLNKFKGDLDTEIESNVYCKKCGIEIKPDITNPYDLCDGCCEAKLNDRLNDGD